MNREEFLMEAALRLITAKPEKEVSEIAGMANELTEQVFAKTEELPITNENWYGKSFDTIPVSNITGCIERNHRCGYSARLERVFRENNIKTVGDLLHIGRQAFKWFRDVGTGSLRRIDEALEELYNIKGW